jgi:Undecaprenyl-phosphate galactose phosphotransferase WbaP
MMSDAAVVRPGSGLLPPWLRGTAPMPDASPRLLCGRRRSVKRAVDLGVCLLLLPVLLPVMGVIAVAVRAGSPGPIFYGHERIGRGGRRFTILKFRTMVQGADELLDSYLASCPRLAEEWSETQKLRHDPRITRVGKFLRATSLDELPQLWNVLRGDMALVGPRPIIDEELPRYGPAVQLYQQVRPGITGIWQTSGRNELSYDQRVRLDVMYLRRWSVGMDLWLLARTAATVWRRRGAY